LLIGIALAGPVLTGVADEGRGSDSREATEDSGYSLGELAPFLLDRSGRESVVVLGTSGVPAFERRAYEPHTLASVAKIYIIVAFLHSVEQKQHRLTQEELSLMGDMIELSDNDAASTLWRRSGGRDTLNLFLAEKGLPDVTVPRDGSWGDIQASARDIALFLLQLYQGRLLSPPNTTRVLRYMKDVIDSQAWGVGAGRNQAPPGTNVYLKNGWYPTDDGWIVNSAGILDGKSGSHIVVILTDSQPSLEEGRQYVSRALELLQNHFDRAT
jgi:beta-lactamase class A